jgi:hypothetical protein
VAGRRGERGPLPNFRAYGRVLCVAASPGESGRQSRPTWGMDWPNAHSRPKVTTDSCCSVT